MNSLNLLFTIFFLCSLSLSSSAQNANIPRPSCGGGSNHTVTVPPQIEEAPPLATEENTMALKEELKAQERKTPTNVSPKSFYKKPQSSQIVVGHITKKGKIKTVTRDNPKKRKKQWKQLAKKHQNGWITVCPRFK
ncbi:MAG: hypothetical protein MK212_05955 [Saprospiraceae bacterium]|nr:hypothetical protein [Saprospiraceae bacterium]